MLQLEVTLIPEYWDAEKEEFIPPKVQTIQLEHSLVSLSKWESKWCKPFMTKVAKTTDETIDYIKCMTLTKNVNPEIYMHLTDEHIVRVNEYISSPMTATTFNDEQKRKSQQETITSELIYYSMIALNIPFECQKWHLNRLITLIQVCNIKNAPPKKMSPSAILSRNAALNAARKKQLNTTG